MAWLAPLLGGAEQLLELVDVDALVLQLGSFEAGLVPNRERDPSDPAARFDE